MKLMIKQSSWSGWSEDYKPKEIEREYDVNLNKKYVIDSSTISFMKDGNLVKENREIFSFDIIEINEDNIKIRTYQPFSDADNGRVNLLSNKKEFTISYREPLELTTPTMDYGKIFILSLIK